MNLLQRRCKGHQVGDDTNGIVGDALSWLGDVISDAVDWLLEGIRGFFQTIIDVIVGFFEVILPLFKDCYTSFT
ncbi:hypothetical protein [Lentibacillus cibarius]|uniref:hypothetical protein n=1 Tax=Lentibacillus cibarius TaxID=2583219 RepID=UPI00163DB03E|nr:hypothetical protein [Lentibacillus cibarius]